MNREITKKQRSSSPTWEPRIVAFLCRWCSYAGTDLAGVSRLSYPPTTRVILVPCSSRVSPYHIVKALMEGADGVLVSGCHPGDCHYLTGNLLVRRRFILLKRLLNYLGIEEARVQFSWISASEGEEFAGLIRGITEKVRAVGPFKGFLRDDMEEDFHVI